MSYLYDDLYSIDISDDEETVESELMHYGTPRHSGRYPWGSGDNPYQHRDDGYSDGLSDRRVMSDVYKKNKEFLEKHSQLKREGLEGKALAEAMGFKTTSELRAKVSAASNTCKKIDINELQRYLDLGYSLSESARRTEIPESTARSLLSPKTKENAFKNEKISDRLKDEVANKKYIDVGVGSETMLGDDVSNDRLDKVLNNLQSEGYVVYNIKTEQATNPGNFTTVTVLAAPGTSFEEVSRNRAQIQTIMDSPDAIDISGKGSLGLEKPAALERSRIYVRYPSEGGDLMDGVIQLRKGVDDLQLIDDDGYSPAYSQVRINVEDKYYLKGMAIYGDDSDIPKGYDVVFNTSKADGSPDSKVFKELNKVAKGSDEVDWNNPFGAKIKDERGQSHYVDPETGETKLTKINKVNEEGDWDSWSVTLASQFLSKQSEKLIKQQLDRTYDLSLAEYEAINNVSNPTVKAYLLKEFASGMDANAVDLKATGFPRQSQKVILPLNSLKEGQVYAPTYDDGEQVILVRYPHEGTFQIPLLTVNNKDKKGRELLGNIRDAIGIRQEAAEQMSGADYDGDSVTVIPIRGMEKDIRAEKAIKELLEFNDKKEYKKAEGAEKTGEEKQGRFRKQLEMGKISNLITDMTLQNAPTEDLIRAVKYSMTVIDAEKHNLDWKQCAIDNDIAELRLKYQGKAQGGASTLISRAKGMEYVPDWDPSKSHIDPETGKIIRYYTDKTVKGADGKEHPKNLKSTKMAEREDARDLMSDPESGFPQEELYANYANKCKALANKARKESLGLGGDYNPGAAKAFEKEVASLTAKLNMARKNKPYERMAQLAANETYRVQSKSLPENLSKAERKKERDKIKQQALNAARKKYGASGKKSRITFTDREWEAINAGALKKSVVEEILKNSTSENIKSMAMPRSNKTVSSGMRAVINSMDGAGYTLADIAARVGVSTSTVSDVLKNQI